MPDMTVFLKNTRIVLFVTLLMLLLSESLSEPQAPGVVWPLADVSPLNGGFMMTGLEDLQLADEAVVPDLVPAMPMPAKPTPAKPRPAKPRKAKPGRVIKFRLFTNKGKHGAPVRGSQLKQREVEPIVTPRPRMKPIKLSGDEFVSHPLSSPAFLIEMD